MVRVMLLGLLVIAAVCFVNAIPAPQEATATQNTLQETIQKITSDFEKTLEGMKPEFEKLMQKGQEIFREAATKMQEGASKIIPKTE